MLLAAATLVVLLLYDIWRSVEVTRRQNELEANSRADFAAAKLRDLVRDERFLESAPATRRFRIESGLVVVPASVEWLDDTQLQLPERDDLDPLVRDKVDGLTRDPTQARAVLTTLLDDGTSSGPERDWLLAHAAWRAHKLRDSAWRDRLMQELHERKGGGAPAAAVLLHVEVHGLLPAWGAKRVAALPEALARPLLARLQEKGIDVRGPARELERVVRTRRNLRAVKACIRELRGLSSPAVRAVDSGLLVFHGDVRDRGHGALLSLAQVTTLVDGLQTRPWAALPSNITEVMTAPHETSPYTVVPDFLAVRPVVAQRSVIGTWGFALVFVLLTLFTATGLWVYFRSLRREAEAARTRSEFLTMVTHELKTPLAGIRLLSEMLHDGHVASDTQRNEYYERISNESVRLSMLIENVLDLGRIERGERAYDFRPLDLAELVTDVVELFAPVAARDGLRVRLRVGEGAHRIVADRHALVQALLNVLDNARKYASSGAHVDVEVLPGRIDVRDYGPGIPEPERSGLFERFERGAKHRDGSIPGVGLGLYLARTIVQRHGGQLVILDPADGAGGACFRFDFDTEKTLGERTAEHPDRRG